MENIQTYYDAISAGYKDYDVRWQRGYVKRRHWNLHDAPIHVAGGKRKGQLYVLMPSWKSSRYCYRLYLKP